MKATTFIALIVFGVTSTAAAKYSCKYKYFGENYRVPHLPTYMSGSVTRYSSSSEYQACKLAKAACYQAMSPALGQCTKVHSGYSSGGHGSSGGGVVRPLPRTRYLY